MSLLDKAYDVMVIGAGVAGTHAAIAAAKVGARTLLLTSSCDTIAYLGWGPRFGSGIIGRDMQGLSRKGLRQALIYQGEIRGEEATIVDTYKYQGHWQKTIEADKKIMIFQDTGEELVSLKNVWKIRTRWGMEFKSKSVVLCLGTFLGAKVETGKSKIRGGRPGETGDEHLDGSLKKIGLRLSKGEKTAGPVVSANKIKWEELNKIKDDIGPWWTKTKHGKEVIIEPTSAKGAQFYLRGLERAGGNSYESAIRKIKGLKSVEIIKPAYKVVFQRISERQVNVTGETKAGKKMFLAGRIIGADSYRTSAIQGIVAGANAADSVSRET